MMSEWLSSVEMGVRCPRNSDPQPRRIIVEPDASRKLYGE